MQILHKFKTKKMEAIELRIGNWISLGNRIGYIQSNFSETQYIVIDEEETQDTIESIDRFKPIELTKEWLRKTDLKKGIEIHNDYFSGIVRVKYNEFVGLFELFIGSIPIVFVLHIHQLQNLFLDLTGEELKS